MTYDQAQEAFRVALQTGEGVDEAIEALCAAQGPVFRAKLMERAAQAGRKRETRRIRVAAKSLADDLRAWAAGQQSGEARSAAIELARLAEQAEHGGDVGVVKRRAGLLTNGAVK